jgi:LmbE family N-acetylglucosaminyl deacetylase
MSEKKVALAVGAHPDDVEFLMAGTLAMLGDAGYELHIMTIGNGNCGTAEHTHEEIIRIRGREARNAARLIGAEYHRGLVNDIEIFYEEELLRRVTARVRQIRPDIVLTQSPQDYMEDHMNTSRLMVSACFTRGMRNWQSMPREERTFQDVYLYHAQPLGNLDPMRNPIIPALLVDVTGKMDVKEAMLREHKSQKNWLDVSQGKDAYIDAMKEMAEDVADMSESSVEYAEGWRQHLHVGLSGKDADPISEVLGEKVERIRQSGG